MNQLSGKQTAYQKMLLIMFFLIRLKESLISSLDYLGSSAQSLLWTLLVILWNNISCKKCATWRKVAKSGSEFLSATLSQKKMWHHIEPHWATQGQVMNFSYNICCSTVLSLSWNKAFKKNLKNKGDYMNLNEEIYLITIIPIETIRLWYKSCF